MMNNLFSSFDPSSSTHLSLNWMTLILPLAVITSSPWKMKNRPHMLLLIILKILHQEIKLLLQPMFKEGSSLLILSMFMMISTMNLLGLLPYVFAPTSHLALTLAIALPAWMTCLIFGWTKNYSMMLSHLVPTGTPPTLMSFMVVIESISNLIRPLTLSIRLTANILAGHLILSLLGNFMAQVSIETYLLLMTTQLGLTILEMAVAMIQAYVLTMLVTLYLSEVK